MTLSLRALDRTDTLLHRWVMMETLLRSRR